MTPDEQARELALKELLHRYRAGELIGIEPISSTDSVIQFIEALLVKARLQEWIAAPVHAWPDDGTTYPQKFGAELVKYRNRRIIELEASLRQAAGEGTK